MKKILGYDKLRGGYYTPKPIADFIVQWAIRHTDDTILEPSCGDGSFIQSFIANGGNTKNITGVELDPVEAEKAKRYAQNTDTLHKIRFREQVDGRAVTAAFLNSFTLAMCEIIGRSYGGGVLTFEPGEVRKLMIPIEGSSNLDFELIDRLAKESRIEEILDYTDKILLEDHLNLTHEEVLLLRGVWNRLSNRRIERKKDK